MKFIKKYKYAIILSLLLISYKLFKDYWYFAIEKRIIIDKLFYYMLATCFLTVILLLIPKKDSLFNFLKKNKESILLSSYIFILEFIFIIENRLDYTFLLFFCLFFTIYIIILIGLIIPLKLKSIYYVTSFMFLPFYLICQTCYVPIFNDFFSINEIFTLKEGMEFAKGVVSFNLINIFYILMPIGGIIIYKSVKTDNKIKISRNMFFIPIILFILIIFNLQYPVKQARLYTSDQYLFNTIYSNKKFISRFGVTNYVIRDFIRFITPTSGNKNNYNKEINKYFKENKKHHSNNEYTGIFENKNLIFIMAESFDNIAINEDLTPNIYKLMNEGWSFENHFVPVYPRTTCDSEIIYNTSIVPSITDGPTCYTFNKNSYRTSLANKFKEKEYNTNAFHSNDKEFYTRNLVYKGLGYDKFYGQKELNLSDEEKRYDSVFFNKAKQYILNDNEKFLSYIITLSGHSPYDKTNLSVKKHYNTVKKYFDNLDKKVPDKIISYIATQIEVDEFVGELMNELKNQNILDNTVIILTADHYPYTLGKETYESYTGIKEKYLKNKEPLIIWADKIKPKKINELTQSLDVLPTIANLFNLDVDYSYYFGNDVFEKNRKPITYFKDYSWYDGSNYVLFGENEKGNNDLEYIEKETKEVNDYFNISIKILRSNYFKKD